MVTELHVQISETQHLDEFEIDQSKLIYCSVVQICIQNEMSAEFITQDTKNDTFATFFSEARILLCEVRVIWWPQDSCKVHFTSGMGN